MRTYRAKWERYQHEAAYRLYMAKGMQIMTEAVAGCKMPDYAEIIGIREPDNRTGDEIAADIIKRAGLEVQNGSV